MMVSQRGGEMRFSKRDVVATTWVALAGFLYVLWVFDAVPPGLSGVRATGMICLTLGMAASASAVVPYFSDLIHGSKTYLGVASLLGLLALAAGIWMLVQSNEVGLSVLMGAMGVLWLMATIRHIRLSASPEGRGSSRVLPPAPLSRSREVV
jgi:uncharacterized membrane protein HdeD (DUF308 family)